MPLTENRNFYTDVYQYGQLERQIFSLEIIEVTNKRSATLQGMVQGEVTNKRSDGVACMPKW